MSLPHLPPSPSSSCPPSDGGAGLTTRSLSPPQPKARRIPTPPLFPLLFWRHSRSSWLEEETAAAMEEEDEEEEEGEDEEDAAELEEEEVASEKNSATEEEDDRP